MEDYQVCYRESLEALKQKSQDSYDKTVLSLSAGALGLSFAFVKDIVGSWPPQAYAWLFAAWVSWGVVVAVKNILRNAALCCHHNLQSSIIMCGEAGHQWKTC